MPVLQAESPIFEHVANRIAELQRGPLPAQIEDAQELAEREEAAQAYAGEDERHFVEYVEEFVRTARNTMSRLRQIQQECWAVYQEEEPPNYVNKEDWQSRVVIPKPFSAVQFAKTQVRKAFTPEFLSIQNEPNPVAGEFWTKLMLRMLDHDHANFRVRFPDACEMGLAIGTSMELIPYWDNRRGLQYSLIEPWKIHRDTDALSRESQSGMGWVHEEWQDLWALKQGETDGRYRGVTRVQATMEQAHNPQNPLMDPQNLAELRKHFWHRNKFRKMALVREYYGTVLNKNGDLLLPNATYTVAGTHVIGLPKDVSYPTLRWPGTAFSPMPHLLRFDGRGIVQGIRTLWYWMCSLMALHSDNLNWIVNPMHEINVSALVDQSDIDIFPGHVFNVKDTMNGQQAVRAVERRFTTNEVLANLGYGDQKFQEGTFVTSVVQGLPGNRSRVTFREAAQQLDQSKDMFASLGVNIEDGALWAIKAGMETVMINITRADLAKLFRADELEHYLASAQEGSGFQSPVDETLILPGLSGTFSVSGLSAVLRDMDVLKSIKEVILPLFELPQIAPYLVPYGVAKAIETRLNLKDEGVIASPEQAVQIAQAQQEQAAQMQQMQQALLSMQAQLEGKKLELEAQKQGLEAQKLGLEAQKMQLDAQLQQEEFQVERERLQAEAAQTALEVQQTEAKIQQIMANIGLIVMQRDAIVEKLRLDAARVQLQARQAAGQLAIQEKTADAQIAAQKAKATVERNGRAAQRP